MRRMAITAAAGLALFGAGVARAADPVLQEADPARIDPTWGGVVKLEVYGENIPPDGGNHPDYREYWHIFVRNVSPDGTPGPWTHCDGSDGCGMSGFNSMTMVLKVDTRRWASVEGSTFQMHYFNGLADADLNDPTVNKYGTYLTGWSNTWSWPVTSAPPPSAAAPASKPIVMRARLQRMIDVPEPRASAPVLRQAPSTIQRPAPQVNKPQIVPPPKLVPLGPR